MYCGGGGGGQKGKDLISLQLSISKQPYFLIFGYPVTKIFFFSSKCEQTKMRIFALIGVCIRDEAIRRSYYIAL